MRIRPGDDAGSRVGFWDLVGREGGVENEEEMKGEDVGRGRKVKPETD
jgi:hypothetical protein